MESKYIGVACSRGKNDRLHSFNKEIMYLLSVPIRRNDTEQRKERSCSLSSTAPLRRSSRTERLPSIAAPGVAVMIEGSDVLQGRWRRKSQLEAELDNDGATGARRRYRFEIF